MQGLDEYGDHRGIFRFGILPRSEDVEVAQAYCLEAEKALEVFAVIFAGDLIGGVGRERVGYHIFPFGQGRGVAVN